MRRRALAVVFALAAVSTTARPAQAGASLSCSFNNSPYTLNFGSYDPTSNTAATATITVSFTCTHIPNGGVSVTITADKGANGTSVTARDMKQSSAPGDLLPYTASQTAGTNSPSFGDGTGGSTIYSTTVPKSQDGVAITFKVYGNVNVAIPGGAGDVHADPNYTDSVNLTMTYQ